MLTGSRSWPSDGRVEEVLTSAIEPGDTVLVGDCPTGLDTQAWEILQDLDCTRRKFKADWSKFGAAAGPIRNRKMIEEGNPDLVIAFWEGKRHRSGTLDAMAQAVKNGIPIMIVPLTVYTPKERT